MNVILEGKVPFELGLYFFDVKLFALKKLDGGLRPIAVGNTFRRLSAKCAGYHVFEKRQGRYGKRQVGVGTKRRWKGLRYFPLFDRKPPAQRKRYFEN